MVTEPVVFSTRIRLRESSKDLKCAESCHTWARIGMSSIDACLYLFFVPVHYLTHRIYPTDLSPSIDAVGPAELDFEFVKTGLHTWPWRSSFLYIGLTAAVAWHAAAGITVIWSTWLRPHLGPGATLQTRVTQASLALVPIFSGLWIMSQEPLFAFSSLAERFTNALSMSFVYRF